MKTATDKVYRNRRVWLFVTAGTLLVGLLFTMPGVDHYNALRQQQHSLVTRLASSRGTAQQVERYEGRITQLEEQCNNLRDRTLRADSAADYRNQVVKLVRQSGCQLRRLNISAPQSRVWHEDDDPLEKPAASTKKTPFSLETRVVVLSLNGTLEQVQELLSRLHDSQHFAYANFIDLKPQPRNPRQVDLNVELLHFALVRSRAT